MKRLTGRKAISHDRIVAAGARAVRRLGFHGVSVADVMKDAGLTHGGFYAHFRSRDELLSASVLRASSDIGEDLRGHVTRLRQAGVSPFRAFVETYLYEGHVEKRDTGCPIPALCAEIPTQSRAVGESSRCAMSNLHRMVLELLPENVSPNTGWSIVATLMGAVQLARAMGHAKERQDILASAKNSLLKQYDTPPPPARSALGAARM